MPSRKLKFNIINQADPDKLSCGDTIDIEDIGMGKIVLCMPAGSAIVVALEAGGTMTFSLGSA